MTLHRAWIYTEVDFLHDKPSDMLVFFESAPHQRAADRLQQLVSAAWGVPAQSVQHYNMASESELLDMWADDGVQGDARLLQIGSGPDGPQFARADYLQFLCGPMWHQRLAHAQRSATAIALNVARYASDRKLPAYPGATAPASTRRAPMPLDQLSDRRHWRNAAMGL